jgi:hypothetical protein
LKKNYFSSHKLPKRQSTSFWSQGILGVKDAIKNPTSAFENPGIGNLVRQLKDTSRHVMAS